MRLAARQIAALLSALLIVAGTLARPAAAATTGAGTASPAGAAAAPVEPKVVIVVGPTHGLTDSNRADAEELYAKALEYTSDVTKIYSPNATWSVVKPALQGANIVIYLGHGNGFPSPYRTSPWPYSQNGMGLNVATNKSDSVVQYYGEYYIGNEVDLAPNAVVILNHLCYASGSSEPGYPEPTLDVARQRVDNFGAGFLRAGARAVIATNGDATRHLDALFETYGTVFDGWRSVAGYRGNEVAFESSRTAGMTAILDLDSPGGGGYHRSIVGSPLLLTNEVVGVRPTDVDPTSLVVPGAAEVGPGGAVLRESADGWSDPTATLPAGTHVRLVDEAGGWWGDATSDGPYLVASSDGGAMGWTDAAALIPRDSAPPGLVMLSAPTVLEVGVAGITLSATFTESASSSARIVTPGGSVVVSVDATGTTLSLGWDGIVAGQPAAGGRYEWTLDAIDQWGNAMPTMRGALTVVPPPVPATFVTVNPVRLLDTQLGNGLPAGPFSANVGRSFAVAGRGGVPADATAVTGTLRILSPTKAGYVSLTQLPTANPATATIHFTAGEIRATGVTIGLAPDGSLAAVYKAPAGSTIRLVFEVTGYYR